MKIWWICIVMATVGHGSVAFAQQELPPPNVLPPGQVPPPGAMPPPPVFPGTMPPPDVLPPGVVPGKSPEVDFLPGLPKVPLIPPEGPPPGAPYPIPGRSAPPPPPDLPIPTPMVFWFRASYLHWWAKDDAATPILTLGSSSDSIPGAIGQSGTQILYSATTEENSRSGGRFNLGFVLDSTLTNAIEVDFLFLGQRNNRFLVPNVTDKIVARPYIDPDTGTETAFVISSSSVSGSFTAVQSNRFLGGELNYRHLFEQGPTRFTTLIAGMRYLQLNDNLLIAEDLQITETSTGTIPTTTTRLLSNYDEFNTRNVFLGPQIGLECDYVWRNFVAQFYGKIALGGTNQAVSIRGGSGGLAADGASTGPFPIGFLAEPTNIGDYDRTVLGLVPELGFTLSYQCTDHLRLTFGYTYIGWNEVARSANQIDRVINLSQSTVTGTQGTLDGLSRPTFFFRDNDFWTRGITFSCEYRY